MWALFFRLVQVVVAGCFFFTCFMLSCSSYLHHAFEGLDEGLCWRCSCCVLLGCDEVGDVVIEGCDFGLQVSQRLLDAWALTEQLLGMLLRVQNGVFQGMAVIFNVYGEPLEVCKEISEGSHAAAGWLLLLAAFLGCVDERMQALQLLL